MEFANVTVVAGWRGGTPMSAQGMPRSSAPPACQVGHLTWQLTVH